jgi:hypothetical protein
MAARGNIKLKVRKICGRWWVFVPGPIPDFSQHRHFTDAMAKVFFELMGPYQ